MSLKVKRYERVRSARQEALDRQQGLAAQARLAVTAARASLAEARIRLAEARDEKLAQRADAIIDDWRAREVWIVELGRRALREEHALADREADDAAARARVAAARTAVEQIEVLVRRAREEALREEQRVEQRDADELAGRRRLPPSA